MDYLKFIKNIFILNLKGKLNTENLQTKDYIKLYSYLIEIKANRDFKEINNKDYIIAKNVKYCSLRKYKKIRSNKPRIKNNFNNVIHINFKNKNA